MGKTTSKAVWGAAFALWVLSPSTLGWAAHQSSKLDKALRADTSGPTQQVIIRTKPGATASVKQRVNQRRSVAKGHRLIDAVTARLSRDEIAALARDPDVLSISLDADVAATGAKANSGDTGTLSELKKSLGLADWFSGSTVTVAVIDSGIQNLTDFSGRIVGVYDFTNNRGGTVALPTDEYGHGTHVSGLIGSSGTTSNGKYAGVAPGVKILALKVLDKNGTGKTSSVIQALEFAVANKDRFGIRVVNLSLGHPIYESAATDPLVQAVEAAVRAGLVVVAAAGNNGTNARTGIQGYGGITSPGNAPSAITVGAANTAGTLVRTDDRVAGYSSRGPSWFDGVAKPDVLAPGHNLVSSEIDGSTLAVEYPSLVIREGSTRYLRLNGSSMASGVVSGLVAVMIEANNYGAQQRWTSAQSALRKNQRTAFPGAPALTSNAIKAMLQYSATPLRDANGVQYDALTQGAGLANGLGAVILAYLTDTTQGVGAFWMPTETVPGTTSFGGVEAPWSQSIIWGTRLVQGTSLIELHQAAWDRSIVWGTNELENIVWGTVSRDGENIVWGTMFDTENIVWGTSLWYGNALLGENIVWGTLADWNENIVWGTNLVGFFDGENIVWGTLDSAGENIVWGTLDYEDLVWGTSGSKVMILGTGGGL